MIFFLIIPVMLCSSDRPKIHIIHLMAGIAEEVKEIILNERVYPAYLRRKDD